MILATFPLSITSYAYKAVIRMGNPTKGNISFLVKITLADFSLHMEQKFIPGDEMGESGLCRMKIILNLN